MSGNKNNNIKAIVTAISLALVALSGYGIAADLAPQTTTTTTTSGTLSPLIAPKPAGSALSVVKPPLGEGVISPRSVTNVRPHRSPVAGPVGTTVVNEAYANLPVCPPNANSCPDINNKGGIGIKDVTCPETCTVTRQDIGWNSIRNAPNTTVAAICPSGYAQIATYGVKAEYRKITASDPVIWMPYPLGDAASFFNWWNTPSEYDCRAYPTAWETMCTSDPNGGYAQQDSLITGGVMPTSGYGWVVAAYDRVRNNQSGGYTDHQRSWNRELCYSDSGCSARIRIPADWSANYYPDRQKGCDAWGNNCMMNAIWECPSLGGYYNVSRLMSLYGCYYKGGNVVPTNNTVPASVVCGRLKPTWK